MDVNESLPAVAKQAFADFDSAENDGDKQVSQIFKKSARDWQSYLSKTTGKRWKVEPGEYTLALTSPRGVAIDVMWDFDSMSQKVDITVEGPKKRKVFPRQNMRSLGKKDAASVYLGWMNDTLQEMSQGGSSMDGLIEDVRSIMERSGAKEIGAAKGAKQASEVGYKERDKGTNKKLFNRAARRAKKGDIKARMRGEGTADAAFEYLDGLVSEGIDVLPLRLNERQSIPPGMERALQNLISVAQNLKARGSEVASWAQKGLSTGTLDVRNLQALTKKGAIGKDAKSLGGAVARVISAAAAVMDEAGATEDACSECDGEDLCPACAKKAKLDESSLAEGPYDALGEWAEKVHDGVRKGLKKLGVNFRSTVHPAGNAGSYIKLSVDGKQYIVTLQGTLRYASNSGGMKFKNSWIDHRGQKVWGGGSVKKTMAAIVTVLRLDGLTEGMDWEDTILFPDEPEVGEPSVGGAVSEAPHRDHVARNFAHSTLKNELQMILRGDNISQG